MSTIPNDVRRFVLTSIPSVPYLEAALLMRGAAHRSWSVAELAASLYVPERTAAELVDALANAGVARLEASRYRYAPRDEALGASLDRLADCYAADLVGVSNLIHDATQKSASRFAAAFKLRKDA